VIVWIGLGGFSLVYRYARRSNVVERQQTKWVVAGFLAMFTTALAYSLFSALFPPWQPSGARLAALAANGVLYILGYVGMAVCIAFAILRHRLWDIDLILRRTLIYSVLSALLALTYFGGVAVLQQLFRFFTGNTSTAAVIGSTLLIAALFQPLRRRVQSAIDRRFFRRKYDAAQTLAAFAASARDGVDLDALTDRLRAVVEETMQPANSAIWLRPPPAPRE
jgi:hypothetical protein